MKKEILSLNTKHVLITCPTCHDTARNPNPLGEALVEDDGSCSTCCDDRHPWYAGSQGLIRVPSDYAPLFRQAASNGRPSASSRRSARSWLEQLRHKPLDMTKFVLCPDCLGTGRNPEASAASADDDGTCLTCCYPLHPRYAAHHGYVLPERSSKSDPAAQPLRPGGRRKA